jgi:DNA polymerase delta subunit 3
MLYDFHNKQNAKKPESIHATYLLSGTKRKEEPSTNGEVKKDVDGDNYMQSSPFMSSSMPQPGDEQSTAESPVLSITLVREEELESMLNT